MSKRVLSVTGAALALILVIGGIAFWRISEMPNGTYYTRVDNARTEALEPTGGVIDPTGGMTLSYELPAYDADGNMKDISFGTDRELREGAYLRLEVVPIRGVMSWTEVTYEDLPPQAQAHLQ